jgi:hypothetical protein
VRQEQKRRPVAAAGDAGDEICPLGNACIQLDLSAAVLEIGLEDLGRSGLVAGRVRRVDANELLQKLRDLVP